MNSIRTLAMLLAVMSLGASPISIAETRNAGDASKKLVVSATIDNNEIRLSGEVVLALTIEGAGPLEVSVPRPLVIKANTWRVRDDGLPIREVLAEGRERWTQRFLLAPLLVGPEVKIELAPLTIVSGRDPETTIDWKQPLSIKVTTAISGASPESLRPLTGIELLPAAPDSDSQSISMAYLLVPGLLLVSLVLLLLGRGRRIPTVLHDAAWAKEQLTREKINADGCARVIREYLAYRYSMPVRSLTTPEMIREFEQHERIPKTEVPAISKLLEECDVARFSQERLEVPELLSRATTLIDRCEIRVTNVA